MARNGSGFFNKLLNAVGIVDEPQQDEFENRYASGRSASMSSGGRPSTYVPRQQNPRSVDTRTADTRRRSAQGGDARYGESSRYGDSSRYGAQTRNTYNNINEGYTVRRPNVETEDEFEAAAASRRAAAPRRAPEPAPRTPAPRGNANVPAAGKSAATVMFNLNNLGECSNVVDALIAGNIVIAVLEQLDDAMIQRVVDTLSGAAFALHTTVRKVSAKTYLIAPYSVVVNDPANYGRRGM